MDILINVSKQRLKLATNLKKYVSGSQEFVRFVFGLNSYWRDLLTFAQFAQNGNTYNRYLDDENAVYLPSEIVAGECTLTLFGSGNNVIATTNYLTLTIDENILVSDASSTDISESLYEQLVDMVRSVSNGTTVVDAQNKMIDKNKIYVYIGSETGMTNGNWYYWNGSVWTSGGIWNAVAVETDKTLSVEDKAADGKAAGSLVEVGSTQPTSSANKIWIDPTDEEIEIPEMSDLNAVDAKVDDLKSTVIRSLYAGCDCDLVSLYGDTTNKSVVGVSFEWDAYGVCHASGTSTATCIYNIILSNENLFGFVPGDVLTVSYQGTNVTLQFAFYVNGSFVENFTSFTGNGSITIPVNATGILIRFRIASGKTINEYIEPHVYKGINLQDDAIINRYMYSGTDANDINTNGWFFCDGSGVNNCPDTTHAFFINTLRLSQTQTILTRMQIAYSWTDGGLYFRRCVGGAWTDWHTVTSGDSYTNEYIFNSTNNSYSVTASPTFLTDTNAFLAPSGDTTDRTYDIITMLNTYGVCRLGKGDYYVNNLQMPKKTSIIGAGSSSRIILSGSDNGYAIKMDDYCTVSNISVCGAVSDITLTETVGERHGIVWQGNYAESRISTPYESIISDVFISGFSGGGITLTNTGYGGVNALLVSNAYIYNCGVGINVAYWAEFNKFTNVRCAYCYYGCINNGGNNCFVNCDFTNSTGVGMLFDNSTGQSPNNTHGSCIGCVINHTASNTGYGVKMLNCKNGYIFDGCQFFFNKILLANSNGVVVANSNFGYTNCDIEISGGGTILFANNMHQGQSPITVTENDNAHFVNCYNRSTGALIVP